VNDERTKAVVVVICEWQKLTNRTGVSEGDQAPQEQGYLRRSIHRFHLNFFSSTLFHQLKFDMCASYFNKSALIS
jgi:hypothetical protein